VHKENLEKSKRTRGQGKGSHTREPQKNGGGGKEEPKKMIPPARDRYWKFASTNRLKGERKKGKVIGREGIERSKRTTLHSWFRKRFRKIRIITGKKVYTLLNLKNEDTCS